MLLEFDTADSMDVGSPDMASAGQLQPASLLARVTRSFPSLVVKSSRVEQCGGDHLVLIVNNDEYAFRFPRTGVRDLRFEIAVLKHLRHRLQVTVPAYDHVDPSGHFAGYRFIAGDPLTPDRYASLDAATKTFLLKAAAGFLTALHDLPQVAINWSGEWPRTWTAAQFAERGMAERLPLIARHAPQLVPSMEAFYASYRLDRPERLAIVHGDLVGEHMLVDRSGSRLAGIIDFGDVAIGDPAQDLLGLWSYGTDAVTRVIDGYDPGRNDPGLLRRSRNHFIRYRIDDLFECLDRSKLSDVPAQVAAIVALLTPSTPYDL